MGPYIKIMRGELQGHCAWVEVRASEKLSLTLLWDVMDILNSHAELISILDNFQMSHHVIRSSFWVVYTECT